MGQLAIRRVRFTPPEPGVVDIEVNTLQGIRDRGGPHEFLTPQRLDFDLLVYVRTGSTQHTVDFTDYPLRPGDTLWVRAGQVHQWGAITAIEGTVVMFGRHTLEDHTLELIRAYAVRPPNHWPAAELEGSPVGPALELLTISSSSRTTRPSTLSQAGLRHALAAVLVQLTLVEPASGPDPATHPTHEAYGWFRDHIEEHFHQWHKVSQYADRLGYSTRTLNRLARQNTGLSAKELIDERLILEAKRQLSHSDGSISQVAQELGFDDASNFSSYFRSRVHVTPGAFRAGTRIADPTG